MEDILLKAPVLCLLGHCFALCYICDWSWGSAALFPFFAQGKAKMSVQSSGYAHGKRKTQTDAPVPHGQQRFRGMVRYIAHDNKLLLLLQGGCWLKRIQ